MPTVPGQMPGQMVGDLPPAVRIPQNQNIAEMSKITGQVGAAATELGQNEADKANIAAANNAYGAIIQLKDNLATSPDGYLMKQGTDALNIAKDYLPKWQQGVKDITKNLTTTQQAMVAPHIENEFREFNGGLTMHENSQRQKVFKDSSDFAIENIRKTAVTNYNLAPDKLDHAIEDQLMELGQQRKQGFIGTDEELVSKAHDVYDKTLDDLITSQLRQGRYDSAQKIYDQYGANVTDEAKNTILPKLREGQISSLATDMEKQFGSTYALPGGNVDLNKIDRDALVLGAKDNLSPDEVIKLQDLAKGMARSHIIGNQQIKQGALTSFEQTMVKDKQAGMSFGDFQKQIVGLANGDPALAAQYNAIATKTWNQGQDAKDSKAVVNNLLTKVVNGTGDPRGEIEAAWNHGNGSISTKTYLDLQKKITEIMTKGPDGPAQSAWKTIIQNANTYFGKNSPDVQDFLYDIYQNNQGKTAQDLLDYSKRELDRVPKNSFNVWNKVNEYNATRGKAPVGHGGLLGPSGEDQATFKVIKYMQERGWPITPANIQWTLIQQKNGEIPVTGPANGPK